MSSGWRDMMKLRMQTLSFSILGNWEEIRSLLTLTHSPTQSVLPSFHHHGKGRTGHVMFYQISCSTAVSSESCKNSIITRWLWCTQNCWIKQQVYKRNWYAHILYPNLDFFVWGAECCIIVKSCMFFFLYILVSRIPCLINDLEICPFYSILGFVLYYRLFSVSSWRTPEAHPYIGQDEKRRFPRRLAPRPLASLKCTGTLSLRRPHSFYHSKERENPRLICQDIASPF